MRLGEWCLDRQQHDACEFTQVLARGLGRELPEWQNRIETPEGMEVERHKAQPIPLEVAANQQPTAALQQMIQTWHKCWPQCLEEGCACSFNAAGQVH